MNYASILGRVAGLALRRPALVPTLLVAAWRFRAREWYRRPPFLPLPTARYLEWRLHTAYGEAGEPSDRELERYVRWTRAMRRR